MKIALEKVEPAQIEKRRLVRLSPNEEGVCPLETGNEGQCSKRY